MPGATHDIDTSNAPLRLANTHPSTLAAQERLVQARERENIARADVLPEVNLNASHTSYLDDVSTTTARDNTQSLGVSASLSLTKAMAGVSGMQAARFSSNAAGEALRGATDQTIVDLARAKSGLEKSTKTATIRAEHKTKLQQFLKRQTRRQRAGEISASDLETIRARIAYVDSELARLKSETGKYAAELRGLAGDIPLNELALLDLRRYVPKTEQEAIDIALSRNPDLREAAWRKNVASSDVAQAAKGLVPDLSVSVNGALSSNQYVDGTNAPTSSSNVRLDLKVPLFDGGRRLAEVRLKQSQLREQAYATHARKRSTQSDASGQWQGVTAARKMQALSRVRVQKNRNALASALEGERVGARTVDQVLQAYESLMDARIAEIDAQSQLIVRSHELMATLGFLAEAYKGAP